MKYIIKIAVALLIMAAAMPTMAQDYQKVNDSLYVLHDVAWPSHDSVVRYATPVDLTRVVVDNSQAIQTAGACYTAAAGLTFVSGVLTYAAINAKDNSKPLLFGAVAAGATSFILITVGSINLIGNRVYLAPDGVVVKLTKTEKKKKP